MFDGVGSCNRRSVMVLVVGGTNQGKYAFAKTIELIEYMFYVILYLITGNLSLTNLCSTIC